MELLCFYKICNYICGACPSPCFSSLIYYKGIQVCDGIGIPLFFNMEKINVFDVQIPDGRQIRCMSYNRLLILILTIYVSYVSVHTIYMMWLIPRL